MYMDTLFTPHGQARKMGTKIGGTPSHHIYERAPAKFFDDFRLCASREGPRQFQYTYYVLCMHQRLYHVRYLDL